MSELKRLAIYVLHEADGFIHTYVLDMLKALEAASDKLIVITTADLQDTRKQETFSLTKAFVRADAKSKLEACKFVFNRLRWDEVRTYDQILCVGSELVGPVGSLETMMDAMNAFHFCMFAQEYQTVGDVQKCVDCPCTFSFGGSIIASSEFQRFFMYKTEFYADDDLHLFDQFSAMGFRCGYYLDTSVESQYTDRPLLDYPTLYLKRRDCPVFLREVFTRSYNEVTRYTVGQPAYELYTELKVRGFDFNAMLDYMLIMLPQSEICKTLHLNYVLSAESCNEEKAREILSKRRIALVMHLYFMDLLDDSLHYASAMPSCADIYITTNSEEKKRQIEQKFAALDVHKLEVRVIPNRGRDVSSILVGVNDVIYQYDYVCFVHDKKTVQSKPAIIGNTFAYLMFENLLSSPAYVRNIICLMEDNQRMGILSPPVPFLDGYFPILGFEWGRNFELCVQVARELGVTLPLEYEHEPVAPMGTCFWFRPLAFRLFYDRGWTYEDFPPEPNNTDGTLLHAVERLYSIIPQQLGYFPAEVMTDHYTRMELDNLRDSVRGYNRIIFEGGCISNREYMQQAVREAFKAYNASTGK